MIIVSFLLIALIIGMLAILFVKFSKKDVKMNIFELANQQAVPPLDRNEEVAPQMIEKKAEVQTVNSEEPEEAEESNEKEVAETVKAPKKGMPDILKLTLFLAVLGLICAGLLAGMNRLTAPIIEKNKQKELETTLAAVGVKNPVLVVDIELVGGVRAIYEGQINNADCYVFEVSVTNQYTTITTLVVIGKSDRIIKALSPVAGTPSFTTHGLDGSFSGNNFGVVGANQSNYQSAFENISGATVSSGSISRAVALAYEQFGKVGN